MSTTGPLEDRIAIRETLEAYADAVFRRDGDAWGATWAENAEWDLAGTQVSGKANIVGLWTTAMKGFSFVAFFVQAAEIRIDGARAQVRSYTVEELVETGGNFRHIVGRYDDEMVKTDGRWLFARRTYRILRES